MKRCVILAVATAVLGGAAPAWALNGSGAVLSCDPATPQTGAATTCTVTVSDTGPDASTTPSGDVTFSSAPTSGTYGGGGKCTLTTSGACTVTFTPTAGGDYTLKASFGGDAAHSASSATASITAVDPTSTTLACDPSALPINTTTTCTATISDTGSPQPPTGQVTFTSNPSTGDFGPPGQCQWTPAQSGSGGTDACPITFTPSAPGGYTLTASYAGDRTHGGSAGTTPLTANTSLNGNGPSGTDPGVTLSEGSSVPTAPPPGAGTVAIAGRKLKASAKRVAGVPLTCSGKTGATCGGILTLTTKVKVKHHRKHKRTRVTTKIVKLGSVTYSLLAPAHKTIRVKLSKRTAKLLAAASHHRLKITASASGKVRSGVLKAAHKRHHKKRHRKPKH